MTKEGIIKFNEGLKKVYDGNEWGMIVNHTTGQISQIVTNHSSKSVDPLNLVDYGENDKLTVIHNHTDESTFSDVDLGKLIYEENVKSCIAFTTKKLYIADTNITDKDYAKKIYYNSLLIFLLFFYTDISVLFFILVFTECFLLNYSKVK